MSVNGRIELNVKIGASDDASTKVEAVTKKVKGLGTEAEASAKKAETLGSKIAKSMEGAKRDFGMTAFNAGLEILNKVQQVAGAIADKIKEMIAESRALRVTGATLGSLADADRLVDKLTDAIDIEDVAANRVIQTLARAGLGAHDVSRALDVAIKSSQLWGDSVESSAGKLASAAEKGPKAFESALRGMIAENDKGVDSMQELLDKAELLKMGWGDMSGYQKVAEEGLHRFTIALNQQAVAALAWSEQVAAANKRAAASFDALMNKAGQLALEPGLALLASTTGDQTVTGKKLEAVGDWFTGVMTGGSSKKKRSGGGGGGGRARYTYEADLAKIASEINASMVSADEAMDAAVAKWRDTSTEMEETFARIAYELLPMTVSGLEQVARAFDDLGESATMADLPGNLAAFDELYGKKDRGSGMDAVLRDVENFVTASQSLSEAVRGVVDAYEAEGASALDMVQPIAAGIAGMTSAMKLGRAEQAGIEILAETAMSIASFAMQDYAGGIAHAAAAAAWGAVLGQTGGSGGARAAATGPTAAQSAYGSGSSSASPFAVGDSGTTIINIQGTLVGTTAELGAAVARGLREVRPTGMGGRV